ncbi:cadherin-23-like [Tubulanus polymorphus]|uniref:cadherin-23-like n=1 Tax=Tubulanus polymorphus TaxID=672921 RepID=UPI003DA3FAD7
MTHLQHSISAVTFLALISLLFRPVVSNDPPHIKSSQKVPLVVLEDLPIGHTITNISITDKENDPVTVTILGDLNNKLVRLERYQDNYHYHLKLREPLDYEQIKQYTIRIKAQDLKNNEPILQFRLFVQNVNDNNPLFVNLPYEAEISESTPVGSTIFTVSASDLDESAIINYLMKAGQEAGMFTMEMHTGKISLAKPIDYEKDKFFQVEVIAVNDDDATKNSTTNLLITVLDVQDTPPKFDNLPYSIQIPENTSVDESVLRLIAHDGDRGIPNPLQYSITAGSTKYFKVDPTTGWIMVKQSLNREDPSLLATNGVLELTVRASEVTTNPKGQTTADTVVRITVTDVNDEKPTFNQQNYVANVIENTQTGIPITFMPAPQTEMKVTDLDQGINGQFKLTLEQNGQPYTAFEVAPSVVYNTANVMIRVKNSSVLNYEKQSTITFKVVATETQTTEKRSSSADIVLSITDVNDHFPVFSKQSYDATVPENSPKGTSITTITATDSDKGINGKITYSLVGSSASKFTVNPNTGLISVNVDANLDKTLLDRETIDAYYLVYIATDGAGGRSNVQVIIKLTDRNDNKPEFRQTKYDGLVLEGQSQLVRPVKIEASDRDLTPNNQITYSIKSGDPQKNFTINPSTGEISLTAPLDYEKMDPALNGQFTLIVSATDKGNPPLSNDVTVVIKLEDTNDNTPFFDKNSYSASIPENSLPDTNVTQVIAQDDDRPGTLNSEIFYRIESGAKDKFKIGGQDGVIKVETGANLDRDTQTQYVLKVLAIDRGTPTNTGSTTVTITITDVNNKAPTFKPTSVRIEIAENLQPQQVVYDYAAIDLDLNAQLEYSVLYDLVTAEDSIGNPVDPVVYNFTRLFEVQRMTGKVYVSKQLDREKTEEVTIKIKVVDKNALGGVQSAIATLTIGLTDVNDNAPVFKQPSYQVNVNENADLNSVILTVVATDADKAKTIAYSLNNDVTGSFAIKDPSSGGISLKKRLDRETNEWLNFTVVATDTGGLSTPADVRVRILDINDNNPKFQPYSKTIDVPENTTVGQTVITLKADDPDLGDYGAVQYFLQAGTGDFQIDPNNGTITVKKPLNRESKSVYDLTVIAADNNNAPAEKRRTDTAQLQIRITDVNDETPTFPKTKYLIEIQETHSVVNPVTTITADDKDIKNNAILTYSIDTASSNGTDYFQVVPTSGQIVLKKSLKETIALFHLKLRATDQGTPTTLTGTTDVYINVTDVNDSPPVFREPVAADFYVSENETTINKMIVQFIATDSDRGQSGIITYRLKPEKDYQSFVIESKTGWLKMIVQADRENQAQYQLEVEATDGLFVVIKSIIVHVRDANDNLPMFDKTKIAIPYVMSVPEGKANVLIGMIPKATDRDSKNLSIICYFIVGGDPQLNFNLEKLSGKLFLVKSMDRETVPFSDIVIKATGECNNKYWDRTAFTQPPAGRRRRAANSLPLTDPNRFQTKYNATDPSLLLIKVKLQDINDNPPVFTKKKFSAGVTRDTQKGDEVYNFFRDVTDKDIGNNSIHFFYIDGPIQITAKLKEQLQERSESVPFVLEKMSAVLSTNIFFQANMQGYFNFKVKVNDSSGMFDTADMAIYLLNENQRVKVVFRGTTNEVGKIRRTFADFLSNQTGATINVDKITSHKGDDGKSDDKLTDMFIHAVDNKGQILDARYVLDLVDTNYASLEAFFKEYNVIEVLLAVEPEVKTDEVGTLRLALAVVAVALGVAVILLIILLWCCRRTYRRKLKAATAMAFGSKDTTMNHLQMPGTNLHTYEGSNPIWMESYENKGFKPEDTDSKNSLDENDIDPTMLHYDEQEVSVDLYNDEYDHPNNGKIPNSAVSNSDIYLSTALKEHDAAKNHNDLNQNTARHRHGNNASDAAIANDTLSSSTHGNNPTTLNNLETTDI